MRVLGIETSCDDTGVAIFDEKLGLIAHELYSQTSTHAPFGGIVPELASRDHINKLLPLIKQMLAKTKIELGSIDGIAYTAGPGLVGALLVGASLAKGLGYALGIPTIGVHHMEGHLLAALLEDPPPPFPFLSLLVSGGHTLLVEVLGIGQYTILGESLDDAAGEAFDKTAKLLGLGYPGGAALAKLAENGQPHRFHFPRPLTDRPGLDFSFSGLKTFAMNTLANHPLPEDHADIAYAFEEAVVETLFIKCKRALKQTQQQRLVVAGGVGANKRLRARLKHLEKDLDCQVYYPRLEFCTDNGAMIAFAGYQRLKKRPHIRTSESMSILVRPRWPMDTLSN